MFKRFQSYCGLERQIISFFRPKAGELALIWVARANDDWVDDLRDETRVVGKLHNAIHLGWVDFSFVTFWWSVLFTLFALQF